MSINESHRRHKKWVKSKKFKRVSNDKEKDSRFRRCRGLADGVRPSGSSGIHGILNGGTGSRLVLRLGRIHDATFSNLVISDTGFAINCVGAYLKGNRGTDITDIRFSNLRVATRQFLWMHHRHSTEAVFSNIVFDGVSGTVEQPSLIDMNEAMPAKGICFINVDVPQGVRVKNADASFCGGTFKSVE